MRKPNIIAWITLLSTALFGAQSATLKEISRPEMMAAAGDKIYVTQETSVFIYSRGDFKLLTRIGKPGEGPGEFKMGHAGEGILVHPVGSRLLVNSEGKITFFSLEGKYLEELKVPPFLELIPLGENFVSRSTYQGGEKFPLQSVAVFNDKLEKKAELYRSRIPIGMGAEVKMPAPAFVYRVYDGKVFLAADGEKFRIDVFDTAGKKLYRIEKIYDLIPTGSTYRQEVTDWYKTNPRYKNFWSYFERVLAFQDHFPAIRDFLVTGDNIYILTYKKQGDNSEWLVLDLEGKEKHRLYLPLRETSPLSPPPYTIYSGSYYYLEEDEEQEAWILHSLPLKHK